MQNKAFDELWNIIVPWFTVGDRRILLTPIVAIPVFFAVLSKLYPSHSFQETLNSLYFITGVSVIVVGALSWFFLETRLPPPKDKWVLLVPLFASVSDSDEERGEGRRLQRRIINSLRERSKESRLAIDVRTAKLEVNPEDESGVSLAKILGRHARAHAVLCGSVVFDTNLKSEDYRFYPLIISMTAHRIDEGSPPLDPLQLPPEALESDLKQAKIGKTEEIVDIVSIVASLPFYHRREYKKFIEALDQIKIKSPDLEQYRAKALLMLGNPKALSVAVEAVKLDPSNPECWFAAGLILMAGQKWSIAREVMDRVRELDPRHLGSAYAALLATGQELEEKSREVNEIIEKVGALREENRPLLEVIELCKRGDAQLREKNFTESLKTFEEALSVDPTWPSASEGKKEALLGLGDIRLAENDLHGALTAFEVALSIDNDSYKAILGKAETLLALQRVEESIQWLEAHKLHTEPIRRLIAEQGEQSARNWLSDHRKLEFDELMARMRTAREQALSLASEVQRSGPKKGV